jgi:hypothetical protein
MLCANYITSLLFLFQWFLSSHGCNGDALMCALDELDKQSLFPKLEFKDSRKHSKGCSFVGNVCSYLVNEDDKKRLACCKPHNVRVLYNVKITDKKVILFKGKSSKTLGKGVDTNTDTTEECNSGSVQKRGLPVIPSVGKEGTNAFTLPTVVEAASFDEQCPNPQPGTLHIIASHTRTNLFHALNDNILPFFSHLVLDASISPQWTNEGHDVMWAPLPTITSSSMSFSSNGRGGISRKSPTPRGKTAPVPHMQWIADAANNILSFQHLNNTGVCYRRVIWGTGPRLMYNHGLVTLRRTAAQLLRTFLLHKYKPKLPNGFIPILPYQSTSASASLMRMDTVTKSQRPMRIVIYSRGSSGRGRSLIGENKLVLALRKQGASVVVINADSTFKEQIDVATHADVMMGLHGAGLVHAVLAPPGVVLVELKTFYGYDLDLFVLAADASKGTHAHIDVKHQNQQYSGAATVVDTTLLERVMSTLKLAESVRAQPALNYSQLNVLSGSGFNDTVLSVRGTHNIDSHVLGTSVDKLKKECLHSDFSNYWHFLGVDTSNKRSSSVCQSCEHI